MTSYLARNPRFTAIASADSAGFLWPGAAWDGTAGSGAAAPTESPTLRGSGWPQKAIAVFDREAMVYLSANMQVTVVADTGDNSWIQGVTFYCEGRTIEVTQTSRNGQTGCDGFVCTLNFSAFPLDGDALVYAIVHPYNGYDRLLEPIQVTRIAEASRPLRYISPAGNDTTGNGLSLATAWKSFLKGGLAAPEKSIVLYDPTAGDYFEDSNSGTIRNVVRPIEFRRGAGAGSPKITRTDRYAVDGGRWQPRVSHFIIDGIEIDSGKWTYFQSCSNTGVSIFRNLTIADPAGVAPAHGYPKTGDSAQLWFRCQEGQRNYLLESTVTNWISTGFRMVRNCTLNVSADSVFLASALASSNSAFLNVIVNQSGEMLSRYHQEDHLTVASTSFDGPNNRTTITWSASPTLENLAAPGIPNTNIRLITSSFVPGTGDITKGALTITNLSNPGSWAAGMVIAAPGISETSTVVSVVGTTLTYSGTPADVTSTGAQLAREFAYYSQTPGTFTTVVTGDASFLAVGATAFGYSVFHSDTCQVGAQAASATPIENVFFQRYRTNAVSAQPLFLQAGASTGAGTVSTVGTALTTTLPHGLVANDFVRLSNGSQSGQWRRVISVESTTTATLQSAFTVDQTTTTWLHGKTIKDMAFQLCIFDHTGLSVTQTQWQHGHQHIVVRQSVHTGAWTTPGVTAGVGGALTLINAASGAFGTDGCVIRDSIIKSVGSSIAPFPDASVGLTMDNNHFENNAVQGTNTSGGYVTYDGSYHPTGVTRTIPSPKCKWDYHGTPLALDGSDLVGAVA